MSMEYYQKAFELAKKRRDDRQVGEACLGLGYAYTEYAKDFPTAINYYDKTLQIANKREDEEQIIKAYLGLAVSYKLNNQYQTSIEYYQKILEVTKAKEDTQLKAKVYIGLGDAFQLSNQIEKAVANFTEALNTAKEQEDSLHETEAYIWLGNVYRLNNGIQPAIDSYEKALKIAKARYDTRQQTEAYFGLGHAHKMKQNVQLAVNYYREALELSIERKDRRQETEAYFGLADSYRLNDKMQQARENYHRALEMAKKRGDMRQMTDAHLWLGHIFKSENRLQLAIKEYEIAMEFARKQGDERQETEALLGLGDAEKFANEEGDGKMRAIGQDISSRDEVQLEQIPQISEVLIVPQQAKEKELSGSENLVRLEECTTGLVSQSATLKGAFRENLKEKECQNFVHEDGSILNLASSHLQKNKSTKIPAILLERFGHYIKSIGRIACGKVVGTCFLVTNELVITNHHVYDNIKRERCQPQNENLPIIISFDYYYPGQTENFVDVEVDEAQDPQIESKEVDYKLLRMKKRQEDKRLENRDQLGALIRGRPLQERQIVIIGHPEGKQLHHETCVVVSDHSISETLNQRYKIISGEPMSEQKSKEFYEEYKESLSYDTSLFSGASGSPIFDMDGYIVAMHSKGHTLKNLADGKTYSLMEFAVPFNMICKDLERTKDENFVKEIFPHYDLDLREVPMDH